MVWITLLQSVGNSWRAFCLIVVLPTALVGACAGLVYPSSLQVDVAYDVLSENEDVTIEPSETPDNGELGAGKRAPSQISKYPENSVASKHLLLPLVLCLYCLWYGSAISLESNSGNIMQSLRAGDDAFKLVLGFGVGQTCGRLSSLFFALWARQGDDQTATHRLLLQPIVGTVLLVFIHLYAAFGPATPLSATLVIALSGVPYGLSWTSLFHTLDAVFASDSISITLGMAFGPGLGPLLMNALVGMLYEAQIPAPQPDHIAGHHATTDNSSCYGEHCYSTSYYVLVILDLAALIMAVSLYWICLWVDLPVHLSDRHGYGAGESKRCAASSL